MADIEITLQPHYGPRFYRSPEGHDLFENRMDSRNCIGPRIATRIDKENHPKLWADHLASITKELDLSLPDSNKRKKVK